MDFLKWTDATFPTNPTVPEPECLLFQSCLQPRIRAVSAIHAETRARCFRTYVQDLMTEDVVFLRPWHLPYESSCGFKGILEPDRVCSNESSHVLPCGVSKLPCFLALEDIITQLCQLIVVNGHHGSKLPPVALLKVPIP